MKKLLLVLITCLMFNFISIESFSQSDVIYLTNEVILRGKIIEENDKNVTIKTSEGTYNPNRENIEKIIRGEVPTIKNEYFAITPKDKLTISYRNPGIATMMSLVFFGGGQFYNAQPSKGLTYFFWGTGSLGLFYASQLIEQDDESPTIRNVLPYLALASSLTCWIVGMVDANETALKINRGEISLASFNLGNNKLLTINPDVRSYQSGFENGKANSQMSYGLNMKLSF